MGKECSTLERELHTKFWKKRLKKLPEGKRLRSRWGHYIRMDGGNVGWDSSGSGQRPVTVSCEHGNEI
jgi:hypothetical protein